jgi:hypothetical protein
MVNLIKELKRIGLGLLFVIVFYSIIVYFQLAWYWVWGIICLFILGQMIWKKQFNLWKYIKNISAVLGLILLIRILSGFGTWGYILGIVAIIIYILLNKRKEYINVKHTTEQMIWGKPIKEFMDNKERLPKIKITGLRKRKDTKQHPLE